MKAFQVVVSIGDPPFPEGALILQRGSRQIMLFAESRPTPGYGTMNLHNIPESVIAQNPHFKKVEVPGALWDVLMQYKKARRGDSKKTEQESQKKLDDLLGPELQVFLHLGGVTPIR